jgi:hypothetical protein
MIAALSVAAGIALSRALPLPDGEHDYNGPGFVVRHAWVKFGLLLTTPLRDDLSRGEEDARIARFFELNLRIGELERTASDPAVDATIASDARAESGRLREERANMENDVELIFEGRLTRIVKEAGLARSYGTDVVWPPVNIEFEDPPAVLVKSPRSTIRKDSEHLLDGDLTIGRRQELEAEAEGDGETSALVVDIGGIALYPAIIPPSSNYRFVLDDIAHEWMHHYLYFSPLGRRYYDSAPLTTLNETVANMAGAELGARLLDAYPLGETRQLSSAPVPPAPAPVPRIDFTTEMRTLRRQVEALLAEGKVDEAERLMEEKRRFLNANGYYIRKLNQAYFAFHGSYADSAGSIDPIGPKLHELRGRSASLEEFIASARELTSESDLDRLLSMPP